MRTPKVAAATPLLLLLMMVMVLATSPATAVSDSVETAALLAFKNAQKDPDKKLSNWQGGDPCGVPWQGIYCETNATTNVSHVIEIRVMNYNLQGKLVPELGNMSQLLRLDVINNGMTGTIPPELGKLTNLQLFLVNSNYLTGSIPTALGNLNNMIRFQIDRNQITGSIPVEFGNLTKVNHLHMNNNSLSGPIPRDLGRLPDLNHLIVNNNNLTGPLPDELANIPGITIIQVDSNPIASTLPTNWTQIPSLLKLSLRNCSLTGTMPTSISQMPNLTFIDLSSNKFNGSFPTNFSSTLITVAFGSNQLSGTLPSGIGSLDNLQDLDVSNNKFSGTIPDTIGTGSSFSNSSEIVVLDFQNNNFNGVSATLTDVSSKANKSVWLAGNPSLCGSTGLISSSIQLQVCTAQESVLNTGATGSGTIPSGGTCPKSCPSNQALVSNATSGSTNGSCWCATPTTVHIRLKSPSFTFIDTYVSFLEGLTARALNLSSYQVQVTSAVRGVVGGFTQDITLQLFPASGTSFSQAAYENLFLQFASWRVSAGDEWSLSVAGPYDLLDFFSGTSTSSQSKGSVLSTGAVVGIVVGCVAAASAVAVLLSFLFLRRRWRKNQDAERERLRGISLPPGVIIKGVKGFTFVELSRATEDFSPTRELGQGGYGKVYKGILEDGSAVAIKRAQEGSMQGAVQFYTEIELLSRVHHRNLVSLVGYCNDKGEQMLVYEFMAGGTLRDHLIPTEIMDFTRRMHIALGTARGILYLHTEADPPIFHRDIKASNILLDERYNAKVADFGLSKLAPIPDLNGATAAHVSTIVKGTPGYLDPEYFMTQKLTDKTDVYSFGVVLLELITGMMPISHGKNIVREVTRAMENGDVMSIADPQMGTYPSEKGLEPLLKLALACCQNESEARPRMVDIVRELEDIWRITGNVSTSWKTDSSDTFSIDMDQFLRNRKAGEQSSESFRDISALSIETNDQTGELKSKAGGAHHVAPR